MDINVVRSLITVAGFLCFVAIVIWAYSASAKPGFEEAARLPFADDDDTPGPALRRSGTQNEGKAS